MPTVYFLKRIRNIFQLRLESPMTIAENNFQICHRTSSAIIHNLNDFIIIRLRGLFDLEAGLDKKFVLVLQVAVQHFIVGFHLEVEVVFYGGIGVEIGLRGCFEGLHFAMEMVRNRSRLGLSFVRLEGVVQFECGSQIHFLNPVLISHFLLFARLFRFIFQLLKSIQYSTIPNQVHLIFMSLNIAKFTLDRCINITIKLHLVRQVSNSQIGQLLFSECFRQQLNFSDEQHSVLRVDPRVLQLSLQAFFQEQPAKKHFHVLSLEHQLKIPFIRRFLARHLLRILIVFLAFVLTVALENELFHSCQKIFTIAPALFCLLFHFFLPPILFRNSWVLFLNLISLVEFFRIVSLLAKQFFS